MSWICQGCGEVNEASEHICNLCFTPPEYWETKVPSNAQVLNQNRLHTKTKRFYPKSIPPIRDVKRQDHAQHIKNIEKQKKCPYCAENIMETAIKCKHCNEWMHSTKRNHHSYTARGAGKSENLKVSVLSPKYTLNQLLIFIGAVYVFCLLAGLLKGFSVGYMMDEAIKILLAAVILALPLKWIVQRAAFFPLAYSVAFKVSLIALGASFVIGFAIGLVIDLTPESIILMLLAQPIVTVLVYAKKLEHPINGPIGYGVATISYLSQITFSLGIFGVMWALMEIF